MTVYEESLPIISPLYENEELDPFFYELDSPFIEEYTQGDMNPIQQRMVIILGFVLVGIFLFAFLAIPQIRDKTTGTVQQSNNAANTGFATSHGGISPLFTREVQHWTPQIMVWAETYNLDPNMIATVMQIESCGDPAALSYAGAQGLFQVMPFHFQPGEDAFDPNTNAMRGMIFLADLHDQFGEPGLAFAGYNGGPGNAVKAWGQWPAEMQRYYRWATGIYADAAAGHEKSQTLNEWLAAGGAGGCARAADSLGLR